jgi:hypothetical protein
MSVLDGHKTMARALRRALKDKQVELGHGECLELVAKTLGFTSWNVLSAKGRDEVAPACSFCGRRPGEVKRLMGGPSPSTWICQDCAIEQADVADHREVMERLDRPDELTAYLSGKTPAELERLVAIAGRRLAGKTVAIDQLAALAAGKSRDRVVLAPGVETIRWETLSKRPRAEVAAMCEHQKGELVLTKAAIDAVTSALGQKAGCS